MAESEKSISWIVTAVMIVIAIFGWGFLAGSYDGAHSEMQYSDGQTEFEGLPVRARRPGRWSVVAGAINAGIYFTATSFKQLPNFFSVISWHLTNRIWLPGIILVLEAGAFVGGLALTSLEKKLAQPYRRRR
jgi:hypothetical protein